MAHAFLPEWLRLSCLYIAPFFSLGVQYSLSSVPIGADNAPPFVIPLKALTKTPISTLALVAETSPEQLRERLAKGGVDVKSNQQSVNDLVAGDLRKQVLIMKLLFMREE